VLIFVEQCYNNHNNRTLQQQRATLPIMASKVWVQLYVGEAKSGDALRLKIEANQEIEDLKKAAYDAKDKSLGHCNAADLLVYAPDTERPFSEQTSIRGDRILKELINELGNKNPQVFIGYDHPLIAVAPAPPPAQKQQQRLVFCRTWSSEGNHLPYNLLANSYDDLKRQASHKFKFDADKVTLYYIPNRNDLTSRKRIQGDSDLEEFMQISNTPAVLAWERGSDGSPTEFPGEIAAPFSGSSVSSISTSTRGHIQKVFQAAVLERDMQKCVVSGKEYKQGSHNVEAAHIIPATSPPDLRRQAGLHGLYDTRNGMLLESRLHEAFDSYVWCMDEEGKFRLSDAESHTAKIKDYGLAKWEGNSLNLRIGFDPDAPTKETLKARYELFRAMVAKSKAGKKVSRKKKKKPTKNPHH
jgi:HNH endonuclease